MANGAALQRQCSRPSSTLQNDPTQTGSGRSTFRQRHLNRPMFELGSSQAHRSPHQRCLMEAADTVGTVPKTDAFGTRFVTLSPFHCMKVVDRFSAHINGIALDNGSVFLGATIFRAC